MYEGFNKVGEKRFCSACGHAFDDADEIPSAARKAAPIFTAADRPRTLDIFKDDEKGRNCRYCRHYIVNPFTQRCGLHEREVKATDYCDDLDPGKD